MTATRSVKVSEIAYYRLWSLAKDQRQTIIAVVDGLTAANTKPGKRRVKLTK